jgi:5-methyltetrahydrofolate--homocysteine methyltransferase
MPAAVMTRTDADIEALLRERILILDGAMGTLVQALGLDEADVRGARFADLEVGVKNFTDLLCLTRPDDIIEIHRKFFAAGADIVETNSFGASRLGADEFGLGHLTHELNVAAARCGRAAADEMNALDPSRPRFVAGSIGPTTKTASVSPKVEDPGYRGVTFDELVDSYQQQVAGLVEGGVDLLFAETSFDTLNLKAALFAIDRFFAETGERLPVMASVTITLHQYRRADQRHRFGAVPQADRGG